MARGYGAESRAAQQVDEVCEAWLSVSVLELGRPCWRRCVMSGADVRSGIKKGLLVVVVMVLLKSRLVVCQHAEEVEFRINVQGSRCGSMNDPKAFQCAYACVGL
jgi:hypothetical protein